MSDGCDKFYANLCRICLLPEGVVSLKSLIDNRGKKVFEKISPLFIGDDNNKTEENYNEMVCRKDESRVRGLVDLIELFMEAEEDYFKDSCDSSRFCIICSSRESLFEVLEFYQSLKMFAIIGFGDLSKKKFEDKSYLICKKCWESFNAAQHLIEDAILSKEIYFDARHEEDEVEALLRSEEITNKGGRLKKSKKLTKEVEETNKKTTVNVQATSHHDEGRIGFKCDICDKILSRKIKLKDHIENVHLKIRNFSCSSCPMMFFAKYKLVYHVEKHHKKKTPEVRKLFKCHALNCKKFFKTQNQLKYHQNSHSDERQFICWCMETFKRRKDLKAHQNWHQTSSRTEEIKQPRVSEDISNQPLIKRYPCSLCGKLLATKRNLRHHISSVHHKIKNFTCDLCQTEYFRKEYLKAHINKGEGLFVCNFSGCNQRFVYRQGLQKHKKKTHSF